MALTSCSIQPMDKIVPPFDYYGDLFDQYIDSNVFDFGDAIVDQSSSDEFGHFFDFPDSLSGTEPTASPLQGSLYLGSCAKAPLSEPDLLNLDDFLHSQPQVSGPSTTPIPTSPVSSVSKRSSTDFAQKVRRSVSCGVRKHSRHKSLSPRMAQPTSTRRGRQESWAQKLEASSQSVNYPSSYYTASQPISPTSGTAEWDENNSYNVQSSGGANGWTSEQPYSQMAQSSYQEIAFHPISPTTVHSHSQSFSSIQSPTTQYYMTPLSPMDPSQVYTSPRLDRTTSWEYDQSAEYPFNSPVFNDATVQPWQPPEGSMNAYNPSYQNLAAPLNYGSSVDETSSLQQNGLLIQYGSSSTSSMHDPHAPGNYTTSPPFQDHTYLSSASSRGERVRIKPEARSSRSQSPTPTTPRSQKPTKGHTRRKASGAANAPPAVGFVNYTPDDKKKILQGVAKSGSAKTKLRREQEAAARQLASEMAAEKEKREVKRAAAKAVREAGGDPRILEREIRF